MPTKKKKYNARFPPARIKKIMQKDEEVGKVASTVPVMISRLLELFTESLILKTNDLTLSVNARTLTTSHLKQIILSERKFDFLKDLVTHIPDVQANDEDGIDLNSDQGIRVKQRGRPRKKKDEITVPKKRGRKPKAVAPTIDDLGDEDITDSSETEDADSCSDEEDGESTGEDASVEGRGSCHRSQKRQCTNDSIASTCCSSSSVHPAGVVGQSASETLAKSSSSASPADKQTGEMLRPESVASISSNVAPTVFRNDGEDRTVGEIYLPLNLTTAGSDVTTTSTVPKALEFNRETERYLPQQQLPMGAIFGAVFDANAGALFASPRLDILQPPLPPPAHQQMGPFYRPPVVRPCLLSLNAGTCLHPQAASEVLPLSNSTGILMSHDTAPVSSGSLAEDTAVASRVLSDGVPSIAVSATLTSSGHAIHRMPVVPPSFLPGAILSRSMSVPHACSATKPSSLVTLPEEDYDS